MKTIGHSLFLIVVFIFSCKEDKQRIPDLTSLDGIDYYREMRLMQVGDEYGEWGGDISIVRIYREKNTRKIMADLKKLQGSAKPPTPPKSGINYRWEDDYPVLFEKNSIELSTFEKELIENSIEELIEQKNEE